MSRKRLISLGAMAGGGSAFLGWTISELLAVRLGWDGGRFAAALTCGLVGAALGAALNLVAGRNNLRWKPLARRVLSGLIIGGLAGSIGGSLGNFIVHAMHGDRVIGWMIMGAGVGAVDGLYRPSRSELRDGLIGGLIGGLLGGLLFGRVYSLLAPWSGSVGRAAGFVMLGTCIGALVGLVKAINARAWLTVLDGDRPGRQVLLSGSVISLGRSDQAALPFDGESVNQVDLEHARVIRLADGRFVLEDNHSRYGTRVNLKRIPDRVFLKDGDLIRIGGNSIRFSERRRRSKSVGDSPASAVPPPPGPASRTAHTARPDARPEPVSPPAPAPGLAGAARPGPTPLQPGLVRCPKCGRPVPGARPYCVVCRLSF
jgi:hypothetical protein